MIARKGRGRDGGDRATPDTCCWRHSNPAARIPSLIVGAAIAVQRFDAAVIAAALALAGWPR